MLDNKVYESILCFLINCFKNVLNPQPKVRSTLGMCPIWIVEHILKKNSIIFRCFFIYTIPNELVHKVEESFQSVLSQFVLSFNNLLILACKFGKNLIGFFDTFSNWDEDFCFKVGQVQSLEYQLQHLFCFSLQFIIVDYQHKRTIICQECLNQFFIQIVIFWLI